MAETRMDKWQDDWRTPIVLIGSNEEVSNFFANQREKISQDKNKETLDLVHSIIKFAKELVFDIDEGHPRFTIVTYGLDTETLELVICPLLVGEMSDDNDIKEQLLLALIYDVPVVPNTESDAPALMKYHRDLLVNGVQFGKGKSAGWYRPTKFAEIDISSPEISGRFGGGEVFAPAETLILKDVLQKELESHSEATKTLANLRAGIADLESLLHDDVANEANLQDCLTRYPLLFGTDYRRVIPKHRLGSDYEMDYALEKTVGIFDLVEIEASTHPLFTKRGDPRAALVHAERQVLDWFQWLERNAPYAREKLPGIQRPVGYVIIGRSSSLSTEEKERLRWRNVFYRGDLVILTYDDVLDRARNLLSLLVGYNRNS